MDETLTRALERLTDLTSAVDALILRLDAGERPTEAEWQAVRTSTLRSIALLRLLGWRGDHGDPQG